MSLSYTQVFCLYSIVVYSILSLYFYRKAATIYKSIQTHGTSTNARLSVPLLRRSLSRHFQQGGFDFTCDMFQLIKTAAILDYRLSIPILLTIYHISRMIAFCLNITIPFWCEYNEDNPSCETQDKGERFAQIFFLASEQSLKITTTAYLFDYWSKIIETVECASSTPVYTEIGFTVSQVLRIWAMMHIGLSILLIPMHTFQSGGIYEGIEIYAIIVQVFNYFLIILHLCFLYCTRKAQRMIPANLSDCMQFVREFTYYMALRVSIMIIVSIFVLVLLYSGFNERADDPFSYVKEKYMWLLYLHRIIDAIPEILLASTLGRKYESILNQS
eukprot:TRINITY_DN5779_c0_g4_i1.p1 TRINITY_DN5779_c0_g4~~TRINITY_DN5779_c0_g4_i1.p1  ORF type:complete len:330 (+),score=54.01 TRINITY_DN5779_c0_g4_i1:111-1100(+)